MRATRFLTVALPALIVLYAAALRLDAITSTYGAAAKPAWLHGLQEHAHAPLQSLRPATVAWNPAPLVPHRDGPPTQYFSDPYTYPQYARQMTGFYDAHLREPVYVFVTKIWLAIVSDQDIAVSFASATFSVLAVLMTYLLGTLAFSRTVGLGAAACMAIEYDLISCGISGFRDDAFMFAILACAYAAVRYTQSPTHRQAVWLGVAAGVACLTRLTSISFIGPLFLALMVVGTQPWKARTSRIGMAVLAASIVAGPYLFNCWRTFGQPLYAINAHTANSLQAEGRAADAQGTAAGYLGEKARTRPYRTLDGLAQGVTTYPFLNKWQGFDRWVPRTGRWLSYAALLGLALWLASRNGRLLLVLLVTALAPFAVTWQLAADWRFTEFAYPFFLIAGVLAIERAVLFLRPSSLRQWMRPPRPWPARAALIRWSAACVGIVLAAVAFWWGLPVLVAREAIAAGEDTSISAGPRDTAFFRGAWASGVANGNVTLRAIAGNDATVVVPLPRADDYSMTLRLDPFPRPVDAAAVELPSVEVFVNGQFVRHLDLTWNPDRVGSYRVPVPRHALRSGTNRVLLRPRQPGSVALWYVRVHPPQP
jgi:hypothetical protein